MTSASGRPAPQEPHEQCDVHERRPESAREQHHDDRPREDAEARVARLTLHQVRLRRIDGERERRQSVGGEIHVEDLHRGQWHWKAGDHAPASRTISPTLHGEQIGQVLLDVPEDDAPFFDGRDDGREVVVEERHAGGFLAHIGTGNAHGDADVGLLERRRVVDAVAGHRHDFAAVLPGVHDAELVGGRDACVHARCRRRRAGVRRRSSRRDRGPTTTRWSLEHADLAARRRWRSADDRP